MDAEQAKQAAKEYKELADALTNTYCQLRTAHPQKAFPTLARIVGKYRALHFFYSDMFDKVTPETKQWIMKKYSQEL